KGNFGIIDEREYDMHIIHQESQAPTQLIYCNVKSSVEAQQFLFNTLWNKAIPAEERITEIEEGLKPAFIQTFKDADEIQRIDFRTLKESLQTRLTTLIVDRKLSLEVEVKDDTKDNSSEAVGLATYSNSESTVWTHTSIFETLWMQAEIEDKRYIRK